MQIKIENELIHKGKKTGLYNYHYTDSNGNQMSGTFQSTKESLENDGIKLNHIVGVDGKEILTTMTQEEANAEMVGRYE